MKSRRTLATLRFSMKEGQFWKTLWWTLSPVPAIRAHKHSIRNREEIQRSVVCGCFYCLETYPPSKIEDWLDEDHGTALCPECGIDSVIGSESGYPVSFHFLKKMRAYWFRGIPMADS